MTAQELEVQEKQELRTAEEKTEPGRFYLPYTDIHESEAGIVVTMEMPGVDREHVDVKLEKSVLTVTGRVDFSSYEELAPVYTEYNVGNYTRQFSIGDQIDTAGISARIEDGTLTVSLPKVKEATPRRIEIQ